MNIEERCLEDFICADGDCRCDKIEQYNRICDDKQQHYNNFKTIADEARAKILHRELGYGDAGHELCFPGV